MSIFLEYTLKPPYKADGKSVRAKARCSPVRSERKQPPTNFSGRIRLSTFLALARAAESLYTYNMSDKDQPYRVLARKYRPQNFDELIGQDALVRTLKNAITTGRIAHAFMLTGVRGVGKTTTARIIAKALNYKGPDGTAGPTIGDTSDCPLCQAIAQDRHPDVMEMDAASRTGVDDIREILDGVRYAPTEARYKIYVIDEVHMLSKNAFNALLKTLEEPPAHVKFIFATTEIRKVPVTVLSRCQRFDLQRVSPEILIPHFAAICKKEKVKAEDDALGMIARAADGSVRDGLSLLDQAMALSDKKITADHVQAMLGLGDAEKNLDILEHALTGNIKDALDIMDNIHKNGGNASVLVQDLLEITHQLTKSRALPESETLSARIRDLSAKLTMPTLSKTWQILLKGLEEVNTAPNPQSAAEMVIIRLTYAADLPDPADLIKKLKDAPQQTISPHAAPLGRVTDTPPPLITAKTTSSNAPLQTRSNTETARALSFDESPAALQPINTLEDIIALLRKNEEFLLAEQLYHCAHLVKLKQGRIEFRLSENAAPELSQNLQKALKSITQSHWMVVISNDRGAQTLSDRDESKRLQALADMAQTPLVKNILEFFPEAQLVKILDHNPLNDDKDA